MAFKRWLLTHPLEDQASIIKTLNEKDPQLGGLFSVYLLKFSRY